MNKWDLSGALSGVDPKLVEAAAPDKIRQMSTAAPEEMHTEEVSRLRRLGRALKDVFTRYKSLRIVLPVLALLALAVILIKPSELMRTLTVKAYAMALAEHPEEEGRSATAEEYQTKVQAALGSGRDLAEFFAESITEILGGGDSAAEHKNQLYSPLNSYMALAMLAECAGGESRNHPRPRAQLHRELDLGHPPRARGRHHQHELDRESQHQQGLLSDRGAEPRV